jgi:hypothetical protein
MAHRRNPVVNRRSSRSYSQKLSPVCGKDPALYRAGATAKTDLLDCCEGRSRQKRAFREGIERHSLLECVRYGNVLGSLDWAANMRVLPSGVALNLCFKALCGR